MSVSAGKLRVTQVKCELVVAQATIAGICDEHYVLQSHLE